MKKLVIAGGSGFLGNILIHHFKTNFDEVIVLSRGTQRNFGNIKYVLWDGHSMGKWVESLNHATVLINLAGKNVNCRYTEKNKREILESRINSVKVLAKAIRHTQNPPSRWLQAASSTIYRESFDQPMDESHGEVGDDFSMSVCKAWEATFQDEVVSQTSKVLMRTAIVLGNEGGAFPLLKNLARFGFGGRQGSGRQVVSWIHEQDFALAVEWLMDNGVDRQVYNVSSPSPVTNQNFMRTLTDVINTKLCLPMPTWLLKIGAHIIGTETELVLKSRFIDPANLKQRGFVFRFPMLKNALENLILNSK